jgi:hypothetical protein
MIRLNKNASKRRSHKGHKTKNMNSNFSDNPAIKTLKRTIKSGRLVQIITKKKMFQGKKTPPYREKTSGK